MIIYSGGEVMRNELYTSNDADTIDRTTDIDHTAKNMDITDETIDKNDIEHKESRNAFTKTIRLFGKFSLNIVQAIFFSLFAIAAVFFFICVVIKGVFKKKK